MPTDKRQLLHPWSASQRVNVMKTMPYSFAKTTQNHKAGERKHRCNGVNERHRFRRSSVKSLAL